MDPTGVRWAPHNTHLHTFPQENAHQRCPRKTEGQVYFLKHFPTCLVPPYPPLLDSYARCSENNFFPDGACRSQSGGGCEGSDLPRGVSPLLMPAKPFSLHCPPVHLSPPVDHPSSGGGAPRASSGGSCACLIHCPARDTSELVTPPLPRWSQRQSHVWLPCRCASWPRRSSDSGWHPCRPLALCT